MPTSANPLPSAHAARHSVRVHQARRQFQHPCRLRLPARPVAATATAASSAAGMAARVQRPGRPRSKGTPLAARQPRLQHLLEQLQALPQCRCRLSLPKRRLQQAALQHAKSWLQQHAGRQQSRQQQSRQSARHSRRHQTKRKKSRQQPDRQPSQRLRLLLEQRRCETCWAGRGNKSSRRCCLSFIQRSMFAACPTLAPRAHPLSHPTSLLWPALCLPVCAAPAPFDRGGTRSSTRMGSAQEGEACCMRGGAAGDAEAEPEAGAEKGAAGASSSRCPLNNGCHCRSRSSGGDADTCSERRSCC